MSSSADTTSGVKAPIRVLIVDDSALIRRVLSDIVGREADMVVVGTAPDALAAREMIRAHNPDVLTLDIEMPKMNGLDFLEKLMHLRPMPVLMVSTLTSEGSESTLRALELGAVDFIPKPVFDVASGMDLYAEEIVGKLRAAARVVRRRSRETTPLKPLPSLASRGAQADRIVFVGASTGGTEAIRSILQHLPGDAPPVLVTQHMPPGYTATFAARLDRVCEVTVLEASDGAAVRCGHVYIAPGGMHLAIARKRGGYSIVVSDSEPVNRHKPSVEVLFESAAREAREQAIAVMLTGMGKDGAQAMLDMREAGAHTIAQDQASCVVFGMPREAIALGAVAEVLPLADIPARLMSLAASLPAQ